MFRRWLSIFAMAFFATSSLLFPTPATAQVLIGGGGIYGRPTYMSPYRGPANYTLGNSYGSFGMPFGGYGGFGMPTYGPSGFGMPSNFASGVAPSGLYMPGTPTIGMPMAYNNGYFYPSMNYAGYGALAGPLAYRTLPSGLPLPGLYSAYGPAYAYEPTIGPRMRTDSGITVAGLYTNREPAAFGVRMRQALYPAVPVRRGEAQDEVASVEVSVPTETAEVWFQGTKTTRTGTIRQFVSPPLEKDGTYTYEVRARWTRPDGETVSQTRNVRVRAGQRVSVAFTEP